LDFCGKQRFSSLKNEILYFSSASVSWVKAKKLGEISYSTFRNIE